MERFKKWSDERWAWARSEASIVASANAAAAALSLLLPLQFLGRAGEPLSVVAPIVGPIFAINFGNGYRHAVLGLRSISSRRQHHAKAQLDRAIRRFNFGVITFGLAVFLFGVISAVVVAPGEHSVPSQATKSDR